MGPSKPSCERRQHRHPAWISRLRARAEDNRGVAILEAAFVTPVFFILVLGIIEGGLFMNDYLAVSSAVRAGARSVSAGGANAQSDLYSILDVANESAALDEIEFVVIYKASGFGAAPTGNCLTGVGAGVPGVCNIYRPIDFDRAREQLKEQSLQEAAESAGQSRTLDLNKIWFGCLTTGPHANQSPDRNWCPGERNDARSDNNRAGPDYVGVYMRTQHRWVTKMFGNARSISDQSVIQIEPRSE